jgi:glucose-6-phosphate isomerase
MLWLDFTNMMAAAVSGGFTDDEWRAEAATFRRAFEATEAGHKKGDLGFIDLPFNRGLAAQAAKLAPRAKQYADIVVLGIGGSALGPIALRTALRPPFWNQLDEKARLGWPRLHVLDNVDPRTIAALLSRLDLRTTLFLVISKSGGTAETMAQYLVVRARLTEAGLPLAKHLVFVTDPAGGALRPIARAEKIPALDIPPNVGGRFSVLTPVGILPAALIGIDTTALLAGAANMRQRCGSGSLEDNPAGAYALLQWLADTKRGRNIHVMMPYADSLRDFAAWFAQLWAESLGKLRPSGESVGPTPVAALGVTDQHSQVQLYMEGPQDKTVTFITVPDAEVDVAIPPAHADNPDSAYLGGHTLGELLSIEQRATAGALARRGRQNMVISLGRVDAWHIGALIMFLELATAYAGVLYGVNAFDQPGVELGKRFTYAMLGRQGFDDARREWELLPPADPRFRV